MIKWTKKENGSIIMNKKEYKEELEQYRQHLLSLAERNLKPILLKRFSPEDIVQETLAGACSKEDFFESNPDIPIYFKLRILLFQTIKDIERTHLLSQKRDAFKEIEIHPMNEATDENSTYTAPFDKFAASITGPLTHISKLDRYAAVKKALLTLPDNDKQILELRHFDEMSNTECAEVLHITPKAASIRYVRALQKLQQSLNEITEFRQQ